MEVRASMVRMGWHPAGLSVHLPLFPTPLKIQNDVFWYLPFQVLAHPGSPEQRAVKQQCVYVYFHI